MSRPTRAINPIVGAHKSRTGRILHLRIRDGTTCIWTRQDGWPQQTASQRPAHGAETEQRKALNEGGVAITCGMLGGGLLRALTANRIEAATPLHEDARPAGFLTESRQVCFDSTAPSRKSLRRFSRPIERSRSSTRNCGAKDVTRALTAAVVIEASGFRSAAQPRGARYDSNGISSFGSDPNRRMCPSGSSTFSSYAQG